MTGFHDEIAESPGVRQLRRTVTVFFAAAGAAIIILTALFTIAIIGLHIENQRLDDLTAFNKSLITNVCTKYPVACSVVGGVTPSPSPSSGSGSGGAGPSGSTPRPLGPSRTAAPRTSAPTAAGRPIATAQPTAAPRTPQPTATPVCIGPVCL